MYSHFAGNVLGLAETSAGPDGANASLGLVPRRSAGALGTAETRERQLLSFDARHVPDYAVLGHWRSDVAAVRVLNPGRAAMLALRAQGSAVRSSAVAAVANEGWAGVKGVYDGGCAGCAPALAHHRVYSSALQAPAVSLDHLTFSHTASLADLDDLVTRLYQNLHWS